MIGVALFRERGPCCQVQGELRRSDGLAEAPAASAPANADNQARAKADKSESKLGTGHGRSEYSAAQYTEFERASTTPDETIVIYYDSARNLIAQGVMPVRPKYSYRLPQPFPGSFVPDP